MFKSIIIFLALVITFSIVERLNLDGLTAFILGAIWYELMLRLADRLGKK
jgi:hypothetical protein